jgi:RNA polymerase sigma-70 factor (ECF subfamily)
MRVIRGRRGYRPTGNFRAWIFTIARNALTDDQRRRAAGPAIDRGEETMDVSSSDRTTSPVTGTQVRELRERIASALLHLPEEQREVFLLRERGGLDFAQIAELTGQRLATVKSRMRYALAGLRRRLADDPAPFQEEPSV